MKMMGMLKNVMNVVTICMDNASKILALRDIIMMGETSDTYEAIGVSLALTDVKESLFHDERIVELSNFNHDKVQSFLDHAAKGSDTTIGPYTSSFYFDMFNQLFELAGKIENGNVPLDSRQLVIQFPKLHCFQSIQILIRGQEITVISNMRSCNYEDNFVTDVYLTYTLGKMLRNLCGYTNHKIHVIMHIGSLHIFKQRR